MKILYVYPHPDDESFGPAHAMSCQRRQGHDVFLLTLTRGGATKRRFDYGYSIRKMGEIRYAEMIEMARVLDLSGMSVLDLPDSGLKETDPREIESVVMEEIEHVRPDVIVTYPVHGISGFHDHLVTHAIVKRVFCDIRRDEGAPRRLAFHTITREDAAVSRHFPLNGSTPDEIDCVYEVGDEDIERANRALDCYVTFAETIRQSGIRAFIKSPVYFELFMERFEPPLTDIFERLG